MSFIFSLLVLTGVSFSLWVTLGILRFLSEKIAYIRREKNIIFLRNRYPISEVAVIIPAHNEEDVISRTLEALLLVLPREQIYIVSDCSTDKTVKISRSFRVACIETKKNLGKARGLVYGMKKFDLLNKYSLLLINDADTEINRNYLKNALPLFNDPEVAAVAGHGVPRIERYSFRQAFFIAYRLRLWRVMQFCIRYGQTWKYINASIIVPGAFSLYRTDVLKKIKIDAPGLVIEDFNMTFEVHRKKLGKIAYSPRIYGIHQDPYNLIDYVRQVHRWNVGYFQTVKRHGIWFSKFSLFTALYTIELYISTLLFALTPALFILFILEGFYSIRIPYLYEDLLFIDFLFGLFVIDYFITMIITYFEKKPILLLFGLGFIFLRYLDAFIYVGSPLAAWFTKSSGTWKSPKRL